jgi:hypothetical protein
MLPTRSVWEYAFQKTILIIPTRQVAAGTCFDILRNVKGRKSGSVALPPPCEIRLIA